MANKNAATHSGHCQCCGRLQKLPKGVLSLHGYTVTHGYFSGTCRGAGYKPFEESCDQVQRYIEEAKAFRAHLVEERDALLKPATEQKAWVHNYERNPRTYRSERVWRYVDVLAQEHTLSGTDRTFYSFSYEAPGWRTEGVVNHRIDSLPYGLTPLEACTKLNANRAAKFEREIDQLDAYIVWQQERVDNWKPMPLLPVAHKDKEGFKVEGE